MPRTVHAASVALVVVLALSLGGCAGGAGSIAPSAALAEPTPAPTPMPSASPTPERSPATSADPGDTDAWVTYTSDRYGFTLRHPADWTVEPADHDWSTAELARFDLTGHEHFVGEGSQGQVGVSAWAVDPGADVPLETMDELLAWVEDYCRMGGSVPCVGIADRAVPLCRARGPECGIAVLVPFYDDVQAFIPDYTEAGMVIVSVWRPEVHRSLIAYGGATKLLEGYLSTLSGGRRDSAYVYPAP